MIIRALYNTLSEKEKFLLWAAENGVKLMFEHDAHNELCSLQQTERGIRADQFLKLGDL